MTKVMTKNAAPTTIKTYTMTVEKDEDGWFFSEVIGLPGCHTQAKTIPELIERTKEAIASYTELDEDIVLRIATN